MKKNNIFVRCGSMVLAAAVLVTGAWYTERETDDLSIPQMVEYVDTEDGSIVIPQEEVPLATKPTVKTTKKTKRTVKKSKLKKKATKTAKTTKRSKKSKTVKKENSKQKVTTNTTVKTTVVSATKKSSDIKTVTTTIETTVKTTTTNKPKTTTATVANTNAASAASTASNDQMQTVTSLEIRALAPKADAIVLDAFENLGFKIEVNPSAGYSGYFSVQAHSITLKKTSGDTPYHELGHFVGWLAGNVDTSSEFMAIYNNEKGALQSANAKYLTQNSSEYFAESYKEYVLSPQNLQSTRPQTYAFVKNAVAKITAARVAAIKAAYTKAYWS